MTNIQSILREAQEALQSNNIPLAIQLANVVLSSSASGSEEYSLTLLLLMNSANKQAQHHESSKLAEQIIQLSQQQSIKIGLPEAYYILGMQAMSRYEYNEALQLFDNVIKEQEYLKDSLILTESYARKGAIKRILGHYDESIEYLTMAAERFKTLDHKKDYAKVLGSLGLTYEMLNITESALNCFTQALSLFETHNDTLNIAGTLSNIGGFFFRIGDLQKSLEYYNKALLFAENVAENAGIVRYKANILANIANVNKNTGNFTTAQEYFGQALTIFESINDSQGYNTTIYNIGVLYYEMGLYTEALEHFYRALDYHMQSGIQKSIALAYGSIGKVFANNEFSGYNPQTAEEFLLKAVELSKQLGIKYQLHANYYELYQLYKLQGRWQDSLTYMEEFMELYKQVKGEEATKQAQQMEHRRKIEEAERDRQIKLARFQEQEKILHKTLPPIIADRLISGEKDIADRYESVSILFADIVGFTPLSERKTPREVVHILNNIFSRFDAITKKYGVERIKTIGDAYMVVAGAPHVVEDHAFRLAQTAFAMLEAIAEFNKASDESINLRIGVNSGEAMAAVVGEVKFTYDLWSDAVNIASRMESHGEPGKIHCTENFILLLGECEFYAFNRGEIEIKGKGKMKTYFLEKA